MTPMPQTSTPGFKKKAQELRDAIIAAPEDSAEEKARFNDFHDIVMEESKVFLNSAMEATDSLCGYARGNFRNLSLRVELLQQSMNLLVDLAETRLNIAQTQGIGEGDKEIEEPCNRLRNVIFRYPSVDGKKCAERATTAWLGLVKEWLKQNPEQAKIFEDSNFNMNSDGAQNDLAERLCKEMGKPVRQKKVRAIAGIPSSIEPSLVAAASGPLVTDGSSCRVSPALG